MLIFIFGDRDSEDEAALRSVLHMYSRDDVFIALQYGTKKPFDVMLDSVIDDVGFRMERHGVSWTTGGINMGPQSIEMIFKAFKINAVIIFHQSYGTSKQAVLVRSMASARKIPTFLVARGDEEELLIDMI